MIKTGLLFGMVGLALSLQAQMNPKYKFEEALKVIQQNYVDQVNEEKLVDAAIKAMIAELDPHSRYTSREEAEAMNVGMSGSFAGIGIQFLKSKDNIYITVVNPDGPAMRAGVRVGDQIVSIDGVSIVGQEVKNQDVMLKLRGDKGVKVILGIKSPGFDEPKEIEIIRENILDRSVREVYMIDDEIGYISLVIFNATTRKEIDTAIDQLLQQGMKKLILDLQANGGGYVQSAIGVVDEFLPKEKIVFYSMNNQGDKDYYFTGGFGRFYDGDMVVLIDESTASASEIVSGALQDWDRAVIVGRRSFGKGLMQRPYELTDGSVLQLTGARYFTPADRSIQRPYDKGAADYFSDFNRRMASKELLEEGHVVFADSLRHNTLTTKRAVYGGGGITPDRFVPIDTIVYSEWMGNLMQSGLLVKLGFDYVQEFRTQILADFDTFQAFDKGYKVPDMLMDRIKNAVPKMQLELPDSAKARQGVALEMKAQIASLLYTGHDYQARLRNEASASFKTAVKILRDEETYNKLLNKTEKVITGKKVKSSKKK